jgi:hypothetical protein
MRRFEVTVSTDAIRRRVSIRAPDRNLSSSARAAEAKRQFVRTDLFLTEPQRHGGRGTSGRFFSSRFVALLLCVSVPP